MKALATDRTGLVKHIDLLDYIRAVAIIAVLLFHSIGFINGQGTLPFDGSVRDFSVPITTILLLPFNFGSAGVAVFFVVSGFCIHLSFQQQGQKWGSFFTRRFFRLYPAYLAALIFFGLLNAIHSESDVSMWKSILTHLFLVFNFSYDTYWNFNGSFWSLAVEAQLYLIYPLLLFLVAKMGWRRTMITLAAIEFLIRGSLGIAQSMPGTELVDNFYDYAWTFSNSPLGFWFSWSLGAYLADAFLKNQPLPFLKTLSTPFLWLAIVSYFIRPLSTLMFPLFALLTAIVMSKHLSRTASNFKKPMAGLAILKKVGLWSYSIYLLHEPLLKVYSIAITRLVPSEYRPVPMMFLMVVGSALLVVPFSVLWYKVFELPGIALGKRIIQKINVRDATTFEPERSREARRVGSVGVFLMIGALVLFVIGNLLVNAKFNPREPDENNNLAWTLATNPDATKRNGAFAVKLAEDACERTQYQQTIMVGTLAAAYAEAGRFDDAIATAQKACALAEKNGETNLLQKNQELLTLYQNHQPYRESQTNASSQK